MPVGMAMLPARSIAMSPPLPPSCATERSACSAARSMLQPESSIDADIACAAAARMK